METPSALLIRLPKHFGRVEARAIDAELDHNLFADHPCVVVDFSRVKQIDSNGLHMLLGCMVKVARQDGAVRLGEISPEAATMLELTRMDGIFDMFPHISEDAVMFPVVLPKVAEQTEEEQAGAEEPQLLTA